MGGGVGEVIEVNQEYSKAMLCVGQAGSANVRSKYLMKMDGHVLYVYWMLKIIKRL